MRSGGEGAGERRDNADLNVGAGLFGPELDDPVLHMLAPEPRRIADPQARVEQHRISQALARSFRIGGLERGEVLVQKRRWPASSSGLALRRIASRFTPSQGFASRIGLASPVSGSAIVSRIAQANTLETVPSHMFAIAGVARRALRLAKGRSSWGVDAFGCLRSLRARSALDGVSWVQGADSLVLDIQTGTDAFDLKSLAGYRFIVTNPALPRTGCHPRPSPADRGPRWWQRCCSRTIRVEFGCGPWRPRSRQRGG
jgi:hypothetical protein